MAWSSAALCRGLIEAISCIVRSAQRDEGLPRLYAAASLKLAGGLIEGTLRHTVFRGFMPRPH